jgi:hypothetical protein
MEKRCIVIGAGLNIAPARLALINGEVNDGNVIILVGLSGDALGALGEFARQVYQDFDIKVEQFVLNPRASLVDTVAGLRSFIEDYAPCSLTIGIAGDRWIATILSFLAMALATVGGFINVSIDRVFVMPGDKGEPVNWPIVPRLVDLSLVEFRVLRLICSGYSLAKEIVKGYASKYGEAISLQAIERILAKLRVKGLVNGKHSGRALVYEETELGRLIACG